MDYRFGFEKRRGRFARWRRPSVTREDFVTEMRMFRDRIMVAAGSEGKKTHSTLSLLSSPLLVDREIKGATLPEFAVLEMEPSSSLQTGRDLFYQLSEEGGREMWDALCRIQYSIAFRDFAALDRERTLSFPFVALTLDKERPSHMVYYGANLDGRVLDVFRSMGTESRSGYVSNKGTYVRETQLT